MRFLSLETKLKRGYRAAYWNASLLAARATGHPSFAFFEDQVKPDAWRLNRVAVLPERDVIFLPIPKNANSKTKRILSEVRGVKNPFTTSERKKLRACLTAEDISIQELHRILNSKNRLSFAIVRNPYERVFSAWANKFRGRPLVTNRAFHKGKPEINTYLRLRSSIDKSLPAGPDARLSFDQFLDYAAAVAGTWEDGHIEPQSHFLDVSFIPIDYTVRLESYSADMLPVLEHLKAPASIAAQLNKKVNSSGLAKDEYAITPEQEKKIDKLYFEDFERLGYRR